METASGSAAPRTKKNKKRSRPPAAPEEYVKVVPLQLQEEGPLQVSKPRRAKAIKVEADKLTISSTCGYRSAQSSRGTHSGTWYFEINVVQLGDTGHCRLGIGTQKQEIEAPCGYTDASYGYRDTDGSKVHKSLRQPYAAGFREGDTVGVWLHLPEGGRQCEPKADVVRWRGRLYQTQVDTEAPPQPLPGSALGFSVNGEWLGVAFEGLLEGTYYAAASLFTKPKPTAPACVAFNFGPDFKHPLLQPEGYPAAQPFCNVQPAASEPDGGTVIVPPPHDHEAVPAGVDQARIS